MRIWCTRRTIVDPTDYAYPFSKVFPVREFNTILFSTYTYDTGYTTV